MLEIILTEASFVRGILKQTEVFSHNHISKKAIFYVLQVIVNLLPASVRSASPQPATPPSCSGGCSHCPAAAPGVAWQLPACSHHGCCPHHHIQADALVTVILLLMEVIGTSSHQGEEAVPQPQAQSHLTALTATARHHPPSHDASCDHRFTGTGGVTVPFRPVEAASQGGQPRALKLSLPSISLPYLFLEM